MRACTNGLNLSVECIITFAWAVAKFLIPLCEYEFAPGQDPSEALLGCIIVGFTRLRYRLVSVKTKTNQKSTQHTQLGPVAQDIPRVTSATDLTPARELRLKARSYPHIRSTLLARRPSHTLEQILFNS